MPTNLGTETTENQNIETNNTSVVNNTETTQNNSDNNQTVPPTENPSQTSIPVFGNTAANQESNENVETVESESQNQQVINGKTLEEQAKAAFELLGGNPSEIDSWEEIRDSLFEYGRVKYHYSKPIVLEALVDRILKSGGIASASSEFNKTYDGSIEDSRGELTTVEITSGTTAYNYSNADLVLTGSTPVNNLKTPVNAKSIELKNLTVESGSMQLTSPNGDVQLSSVKSTGTVNKSKSGNATFSINTNEEVKITDCSFEATGYNAVEIGLSNTMPKKVVIENCTFKDFSNNAISFFAQAEGAEITVKDCKFIKTSNPFRISNRTNTSATFNFVNCQFDEWDADPNYAGMLLIQDYTNKTVDAANTANLFAPEKIKINVINCYHAGKKIKPASLEACCATGNKDTQIIYGYRDADRKVMPFDATKYPSVTFK